MMPYHDADARRAMQRRRYQEKKAASLAAPAVREDESMASLQIRVSRSDMRQMQQTYKLHENAFLHQSDFLRLALSLGYEAFALERIRQLELEDSDDPAKWDMQRALEDAVDEVRIRRNVEATAQQRKSFEAIYAQTVTEVRALVRIGACVDGALVYWQMIDLVNHCNVSTWRDWCLLELAKTFPEFAKGRPEPPDVVLDYTQFPERLQ